MGRPFGYNEVASDGSTSGSATLASITGLSLLRWTLLPSDTNNGVRSQRVEVLDFVQFGGPKLTEGSPMFELWMTL